MICSVSLILRFECYWQWRKHLLYNYCMTFFFCGETTLYVDIYQSYNSNLEYLIMKTIWYISKDLGFLIADMICYIFCCCCCSLLLHWDFLIFSYVLILLDTFCFFLLLEALKICPVQSYNM